MDASTGNAEVDGIRAKQSIGFFDSRTQGTFASGGGFTYAVASISIYGIACAVDGKGGGKNSLATRD